MELMLLIAPFIALAISWFSIPALIRIAQEKQLYDAPGVRKSHFTKTPILGGFAIFAGLIISSLLFLKFDASSKWGAILSAIVILFFTGIKDDIVPLTPYKKFIAQLIAATILVISGDIRLSSMYGMFGIYDISLAASYLISIFTVITIVNAFNLLDGINGLAGGIACISAFTFGTLFYLQGHENYAIMAYALCGSLIGFLYYNLIKVKIFMGDTGSLIIGLVCSILAIQFIEVNKADSMLYSGGKAPVIAVSILILPLFDTLRLFILRISKGDSPFKADKNHIHHYLLDIGFSHWKASVLLYLVSTFLIVLTFFLVSINNYVLLITIGGLMLVCTQFITYFKFRSIKSRSGQKLEIVNFNTIERTA